ncbi:MAG: hypothetical protein ACSLEL_05060 [Candidatus Malihini olakiniferum]
MILILYYTEKLTLTFSDISDKVPKKGANISLLFAAGGQQD